MSTSLEEMHELEPHIRVGRARAGVVMLMLSDALSILAILAAGGYLKALNTENQYKIAGDHPPAFLLGLLVAIILVLSGLAYYWWERRGRNNTATVGTGQRTFFILALLFMAVAFVVQTWISITLNRAYSAPYDAYESVITLITWFTAAHLLLAVIIGLLLLGRVIRNRLARHDYIPEVVGYWWYYTVIGSLLLWIFGLLI